MKSGRRKKSVPKRNRYGKGNSSQQTQATNGGGNDTTNSGGANGAGAS